MSKDAKTVGAIGAVAAILGIGPCALREGSVLVASRTTIESASSFAGRTAVGSDFLRSPVLDSHPLPSIEAITGVRELAVVRVPELAIVPPVELRSLSVVDTPAIALPNPSVANTVGHEARLDSASQKIAVLFSQAEPRIIDDLLALDGNLSQSKVANVISSDVAKALQSTEAVSESDITFEVLSGKLKFNSYRTVRGTKISLGEVNVYKVSLILAGTVVACASLGASELTSCVKETLATAGDIVRKQMELNTAKTAKLPCRQISKKHREAAKNTGSCIDRPAAEPANAGHEPSRKTAARMPIRQ
jgi:hypothetical protein